MTDTTESETSMRIFLAGGSGVIGTRLIPKLLGAGHQVTATTRREENLARIGSLGAEAVLVDVYDAVRLASAVGEARPQLVLHELTDLSLRDTDANARLRREGTANLVSAALQNGVERMIVQSVAWAVEDGERLATEDEPVLAGSPVETMEELVRRMPHATVLRYGMLYGPTTWYAQDGPIAQAVKAGRVTATPAVTSFVHIDDAVSATVASLDWPDGIYNIVDDEPAAATLWLPHYAAGLGAPTALTGPVPPGTPAGRRISNAKARAQGWDPEYVSWRNGLGDS